jgi:NADH-quinone oxidoreductase subunit F
LSGDVQKPGLYEVPFGVSLKYVINSLAGGMRDETPFQSALIGGAAGAFAFEDQLDTKLTFEDLRATGLPLGSGVITVFNANRDLTEIALKLANFFAEESCGKCFPCQIGTQRQLEILKRINKGDIDPMDQNRLSDIIATMTDTSLCGLGQTAGSAIKSLMLKRPEKFTLQTPTQA